PQPRWESLPMTMATDTVRRAPGALPWRSLLTLSLVAVLTACGPSDPTASFLGEEPEETGVQQQEAVSWTLGANYDATKANITFRVYSARATRIEVWIYKTPYGAQEVAKYVMTKNATSSIWEKTVSVSTLQNTYGVTGPVYYGYRA